MTPAKMAWMQGSLMCTNKLEGLVSAAGFARAEFRGGYDPTVPAGATDRLVVVATRP